MSSTLGSVDGANWHFYAGTYSPATGIRDLYVDGVLAATQTGQGPLNPSPDSHLVIGGQDAGGDNFLACFTGEIYGVRIYNTALSAGQLYYLLQTPGLSSAPSFSGNPVVTTGPNGRQLVLTWSGGTLLQATNVAGPWTTNTGIASPYTNFITGPQMFFRLVSP
jgi:hypothetical protein